MEEINTERIKEKDYKPEWIVNGTVNDKLFSKYMIEKHTIKHIDGKLFDINGSLDLNTLKYRICKEIEDYVSTNIAKVVSRLTEAIKIMAFTPDYHFQTDRIHFNNGTYYINDKSFSKEKEFCINRMPIDYNPDADIPIKWLSFLEELLYPEDIPSLQEFLGYCFIPTNKAQSMLLMLGEGGEGKSRIPIIMKALLGNNMNMGNIQKLATNRFILADQVGILAFFDDDMKPEALPDTGTLKSIVTLEGKTEIEKKGEQSKQAYLFFRIVGIGNGHISALYDKTEGFYRRQLIIKTKPKDPNRIDDRELIEKILTETEGILLWCLEGLHRLIDNGYNFTVSDRIKNNLAEIKRDDNNIFSYFESEGYLDFDPKNCATFRQIYKSYLDWCDDNAEKPFSEKTFSSQLKKFEVRLGIEYNKNIDIGGGKKARGYKGVRVINSVPNIYL